MKRLLVRKEPLTTIPIRWYFLSGIKAPVKGKSPLRQRNIRQYLEGSLLKCFLRNLTY